MRRVLVVVGKAPIAGQVKTRLCPPLTAATAAELHTAFLRDTVALARSVPGTEVVILYPPVTAAEPVLRAALGGEVRLLAQTGAGLTDALGGASTTLLAEGYDQVALISSDNPSLPPDHVAAAFAALNDYDVALGPAEDGGYYLIGLKAPHRGLFEAIHWSTAVVFEQTLGRAAALGLRVATTPAWYDVDEGASLRRLQAEIAAGGGRAAHHTREFFRRHYPTGLDF